MAWDEFEWQGLAGLSGDKPLDEWSLHLKRIKFPVTKNALLYHVDYEFRDLGKGWVCDPESLDQLVIQHEPETRRNLAISDPILRAVKSIREAFVSGWLRKPSLVELLYPLFIVSEDHAFAFEEEAMRIGADSTNLRAFHNATSMCGEIEPAEGEDGQVYLDWRNGQSIVADSSTDSSTLVFDIKSNNTKLTLLEIYYVIALRYLRYFAQDYYVDKVKQIRIVLDEQTLELPYPSI